MANSLQLHAPSVFENIDADGHLETFSLIWLDSNADRSDIKETKNKLRHLINRLRLFHDVGECEKYINERPYYDRIVMVVSGKMGQQIVPFIHELQQIVSIYVYCQNRQNHEQWAGKYAKIKGVVVTINELISKMKPAFKVQKQVEEPFPFSICVTNDSHNKTITSINGEFVFFQVLLDCILQLPCNSMDETELISLFRQNYKKNETELKMIDDFEQDYSPKYALWWYTRESFFYKSLNAALRTRNISLIILFRKYINDIYMGLKTYQVQKSVCAYRFQVISSDELKQLKTLHQQFISVNSFFSSSTDYNRARSFFNYSCDRNLVQVLFQIRAKPTKATTKPFANIGPFSEYPDECEILFMVGSIFCVNSITYNDQYRFWTIELILCSSDDSQLKQVLQSMKQEYTSGKVNFHKLGRLMWEMGKLDLAESYLLRSLDHDYANDPCVGTLYEDLGKVASQKGNFDQSMKWRQAAIKYQARQSLHPVPRAKHEEHLYHFPNIPSNIFAKRKGVTVAGGHGPGDATNQLKHPFGLFLDCNKKMIIADWGNFRITEWTIGGNEGRVVAGDQGNGNRLNQLSYPTDVLVDKTTNSFIISDRMNKRVMKWSRVGDTVQGEVVLTDIKCWGLTTDAFGFIYVSDEECHHVLKRKIGSKSVSVVAGGHGKGNALNQLNEPSYLFVDQQQSLYVSDNKNHRVMKWDNGSLEGVVVAGGQGEGSAMTQLSNPRGIFVDKSNNLFIADAGNNRVVLWPQGASQGIVVAGHQGKGAGEYQLSWPIGLSFDAYGYFYVTDYDNHRVQRFSFQ